MLPHRKECILHRLSEKLPITRQLPENNNIRISYLSFVYSLYAIRYTLELFARQSFIGLDVFIACLCRDIFRQFYPWS